MIPNRGQIWLVELSPGSGLEQPGRRPCLILSTADFTASTGMTWIAPITSLGLASRAAGYAVPLGEGRKTTGVVRTDQLRSMDLASRGSHYLETASDVVVDQVLGMVDSVVE